MKKEFKTFRFDIKELGETGQFSGYLSTFRNMDDDGDIVEPSAFKKTLQENKSFPLLWAHDSSDPAKVVGTFTGEEDQRGLYIRGEFLQDEDSQKVYEKVKQLWQRGVKLGLSMGYRAIKSEPAKVSGRTGRILKEVKLYEGSLTLFPMNPEAEILALKQNDTKNEKEIIEAAFKIAYQCFKEKKQMPSHLLDALCKRVGTREPGFFTRCASMSWGPIDDIDAFCAWLHKECIGKWPAEESAEPDKECAPCRMSLDELMPSDDTSATKSTELSETALRLLEETRANLEFFRREKNG